MSTSAEIQTKPPQAASGAPELVKGLGLTSATMLVMGSMIGSGIFIVSAEICTRSQLASAADWSLAGDRLSHYRRRALSYGELAAMMPRAGGQYVYLREVAGAALGISLRLDAFPCHSDRNHRCRGRRIRQISRHLLSLHFLHKLDSSTSGKFRRFMLGRWFWATWKSA